MKIVLINTYAHGGAGIACRRLGEALRSNGHEVVMLTMPEAGSKWPFYAERLSFLPFEKDKSVRFSFSLANFGTDISGHPAVKAADIIHLHWINQGFLSLKNIRRLAASGKPLLWTLHDMWAFTGGCHYSRGCRHFEQSCGRCDYLHCPSANDLSHRIWQRKKQILPQNIHFLTCSRWLEGEARCSGLLRDADVRTLPNPIDTEVFKPMSEGDRTALRREWGIGPDDKVLLFVAMKVSETRKGFHFLHEALLWLSTHSGKSLHVLVLGNADPESLAAIPFPVHTPGMVKEAVDLARYYSMADVFVIPSLEDNLPNTVMEAMSCGTPVAGFNTGGIPEMADHGLNGIIVQQGDSESLAKGILTILEDKSMGPAARQKVLSHYSFDVIARQYEAMAASFR